MQIPQPLSIAEEAQELINGPRRKEYGPVEQSTERLALAWTAALLPKLRPGEIITRNDYLMLNIIEKALREVQHHKRDNLVDIVGYTLLSEIITTKT